MRAWPSDPSQPLPGEVPAARRRLFVRLVVGVALVGVGAIVGVAVAPESGDEAAARIATLEAQLGEAKGRIAELEWSVRHPPSPPSAATGGKLKAADRQRHERESRRYAKVLRQVHAQSAAELMQWFAGRWNSLLDDPKAADRTARRAELLALLIGGMAANLDPNDYIPWQAEFLNGSWLGDVHFDLDGDGFPAKRAAPNPRDSFAGVSVCQIAMAENQAARDARVLVMPDMKCDRPEAKMSVFLQGSTIDDALTDLVRALRAEGFVVVERVEAGVRLILVGQGMRGARAEQ